MDIDDNDGDAMHYIEIEGMEIEKNEEVDKQPRLSRQSKLNASKSWKSLSNLKTSLRSYKMKEG